MHRMLGRRKMLTRAGSGGGGLIPRLAAAAVVIGLVMSAPALASESITVTPAPDLIEGNPLTFTVATTSDSSHTSGAHVYIRRDDGSPCQATSSAVKAATPVPGDRARGARHRDRHRARNRAGRRVCFVIGRTAQPLSGVPPLL